MDGDAVTAVDDLTGESAGGVERDRWGRPLIVPLGELEAVPYLRASSLKEQLSDDFAIVRWKLQELVLGLGRRRDLWMRAATLTGDDRDQLQEIVESAMAMVEGNSFTHFGTTIHNYLQRDLHLPDELPEIHRAATAIRDAMRMAGLRLIEDTHEVFVINHELRAAGSQDGLCVDANGTVMVWDIKTTKDVNRLAKYKPQQWSVQEGVYANATHLRDGSRVPIEVSKEWGVVCYVERLTGATKVFKVDLVPGYRAARTARDAYDFKALPARKLATQLAYVVPDAAEDLTAELEQSLAMVQAAKAEAETPAPAEPERAAVPPAAPVELGALIELERAAAEVEASYSPAIGQRIGEHRPPAAACPVCDGIGCGTCALAELEPDTGSVPTPVVAAPAEPEATGSPTVDAAPARRCDGCSSPIPEGAPAFQVDAWVLCGPCNEVENPKPLQPIKKARKPKAPAAAVEPQDAADVAPPTDPQPEPQQAPVAAAEAVPDLVEQLRSEVSAAAPPEAPEPVELTEAEERASQLVTAAFPCTTPMDAAGASAALEQLREAGKGRVRAALEARVARIKEAGHAKHLGELWAGLEREDGTPMPTFKSDHNHTSAELKLIDDIVWTVETHGQMPFPDDEPLYPVVQPPLLPGVIPTDEEGGPLGAEMTATLKAARAALTEANQAWVVRMTGPSTKATRRRGLIVQAAIRMAGADDDTVLAYLEAVMGPIDPETTVWEGILGRLTIDQAAELGDLVVDNGVGLQADATGRLRVIRLPVKGSAL